MITVLEEQVQAMLDALDHAMDRLEPEATVDGDAADIERGR